MHPSAPPVPVAAAALAARALDAVGADPRLALELAEQARQLARTERSAAAACTALRAAGLAHRGLGDLAAAETTMRAAVRCGARVRDAEPEAEARMSLAFVLLERGRIATALAQADRAADHLTGLQGARLVMQRALILQRCGRLDEALADYARALPVLRRHRDDKWEARLRNNRGLLQAYRGELVLAERDLERALELHRDAGREIDAADCEWNLGFVAARRGDAPSALERYAVAAAAHEQYGTAIPQLLLDRAEVLLSVGLVTEARETAELAVASCAAVGQHSDVAEAELLLAKAALADGDAAVASASARHAEDAFRRQHRDEWALLARYVRLRAEAAAGRATRRTVDRALSTAQALATAGWRVAELDARLVAARIALALGDEATGAEQLGLAARARTSSDLELQTRAWYSEALLRQSRGNRPGAQAALRAGLRAVDRQRSMLGATELRVHVATHGGDLARLGLAMAVASGSAPSVLSWAERWRAGALHLQPVRPPRDPELAYALAELRRMSAEVDEALLDGERPRGLEARRRELEHSVVLATRMATGGLGASSPTVPTVELLSGSLADRALVEYAEVDGDLMAVTVRAGRCRLFRLGSLAAVQAELGALHFALRRLALGFGSNRSQRLARAAAERAAAGLDALLLAPLRTAIEGAALVVVPTGALHAVPWAVVPTTSAVPVTVAPSASVWVRAFNAGARTPTTPGRVVLAAGPGLAAADAEIAALATGYRSPCVLVGAAATGAAVLDALDGADLAHVSAHGRLRTDNPLFSALQLSDGDLTVYDLERLGRAPATVLLPSCQSGVAAVRAGDEVMGLVSALLALGARHVVATVIAVPDAPTAELMLGVHAGLRTGQEPALALFSARQQLDLADPTAFSAAAGCVAYGA